MQGGIGIELVFDSFHADHDSGRVSLAQGHQVEPFLLQVELLASSLLDNWLVVVSLDGIGQDLRGPLGLLASEHGIVLSSLDLVDPSLRLGVNFLGVL